MPPPVRSSRRPVSARSRRGLELQQGSVEDRAQTLNQESDWHDWATDGRQPWSTQGPKTNEVRSRAAKTAEPFRTAEEPKSPRSEASTKAPLPRFQEELLSSVRAEFRAEGLRLRQDIRRAMQEVKDEVLADVSEQMPQGAQAASKIFGAVLEVLAAVRDGKMAVNFSEVLTAIKESKPEVDLSGILAAIGESRSRTAVDFSEVLAAIRETQPPASDFSEVLATVRETRTEVDLSEVLREVRELRAHVESVSVAVKSVEEGRVDTTAICAELRKGKSQVDFSVVLNAIREMDSMVEARAVAAVKADGEGAVDGPGDSLVRARIAGPGRGDIDVKAMLSAIRDGRDEVLEAIRETRQALEKEGRQVEKSQDVVLSAIREGQVAAARALEQQRCEGAETIEVLHKALARDNAAVQEDKTEVLGMVRAEQGQFLSVIRQERSEVFESLRGVQQTLDGVQQGYRGELQAVLSGLGRTEADIQQVSNSVQVLLQNNRAQLQPVLDGLGRRTEELQHSVAGLRTVDFGPVLAQLASTQACLTETIEGAVAGFGGAISGELVTTLEAQHQEALALLQQKKGPCTKPPGIGKDTTPWMP